MEALRLDSPAGRSPESRRSGGSISTMASTPKGQMHMVTLGEFQFTSSGKPGTPSGTPTSRRSLSSTGGMAGAPGAIKKAGTRARSSSATSTAARILGSSHPALAAPGAGTQVLRVIVTASNDFDVCVRVSLEGAKPEGRGCGVCKAGTTQTTNYVGLPNVMKGCEGAVEIDGMDEPVLIFLAPPGKSGSYVKMKGKFRYTSIQTPRWDWQNNSDRPTEGRAADMEISSRELRISVRDTTAMELKRNLQLQALNGAMQLNDYDSLRAQVTKARMASVELEHISQGEAKLKEMKDQGLHVNEGCDKETIRKQMAWEVVTFANDKPDVNEPCTNDPDCPCNVELNTGEVLYFGPQSVQQICAEFGRDADKVLFESLVEAALSVEDGCIWRAGGKYIFSEFSRNQSLTALSRMLDRCGQRKTVNMIQKIAKHTEAKYSGYVTAIQVNFHPHKGTYHDQHRDIYSVKQSAGPNCTCNFQDCIGTVCYSLGSSRICLLETMTDKMSKIKPCCEQCEGRREYRWLHSGDEMYFNTDWNDSHTHGIPCAEECGPRISLAFLLAAKAPQMIICGKM